MDQPDQSVSEEDLAIFAANAPILKDRGFEKPAHVREIWPPANLRVWRLWLCMKRRRPVQIGAMPFEIWTLRRIVCRNIAAIDDGLICLSPYETGTNWLFTGRAVKYFRKGDPDGHARGYLQSNTNGRGFEMGLVEHGLLPD